MRDVFPPLEPANVGHRSDNVKLLAEANAGERMLMDGKVDVAILDDPVVI